MKKQIASIALWMFFGFVFIKAIDSILKFIVNAYFNFGVWQELSGKFLLYSIPIFTILLYVITNALVIKLLHIKFHDFQFKKMKFHLSIFSVSIFIAIFLNPIQYKLSGLVLEKVFSREPEPYMKMDFIEIYGTMNLSLETCKWLSIIFLSIYFYKIYDKKEQEMNL